MQATTLASTFMMPDNQWLSEDDNEPYTLDARRRAALEEVNSASFSWFHVKVVAVAGAGFLTDA
jgi:PHS family inorganic phosphate transporter-like MFS transporter